MARIAANYAANNPLAWGATPDADIQARYQSQVIEDSAATNCELPVVSGTAVVPDPTFTDVNLDGTATGLGDTVTVAINCDFSVITPLLANVLGGTVEVTAESDFPVKAGMTSVAASGSGGGGGGGVTTPPSAAFEAGGVFTTDVDPWLWLTGPTVTVTFRDASGGGPATSWLWDFGDGTTATTQDATHDYTCTVPDFFGFCSYLVSMKATNAAGHTTAYMGVLVEATSSVDFSVSPAVDQPRADRDLHRRLDAGRHELPLGLRGRRDGQWPRRHRDARLRRRQARTACGSGSPTRIRSGSWVRPARPSRSPRATARFPASTNVRFNDADAIWQRRPVQLHREPVKRATGAPSGNFKITAQSIAAGNGATALCSSDVYVSSP